MGLGGSKISDAVDTLPIEIDKPDSMDSYREMKGRKRMLKEYGRRKKRLEKLSTKTHSKVSK